MVLEQTKKAATKNEEGRGVQLFLGELKPVRMVSADEKLKKFSNKYFLLSIFPPFFGKTHHVYVKDMQHWNNLFFNVAIQKYKMI